jgi:ferritin-like metal-binding protein YciE
MKLDSLDALFLHELRDLHSAERQIAAELPKMAKRSTSPELKKAFQTHAEQTQAHIERLDQILADLELPLGRHKCKAMEGLIEEAAELLSEDATDAVLDAGMIGAAQRVEHYEIAGYGTARTFAEQLGHTGAAEMLQQTLDEEKATDELLTELAVSAINSEAEASAAR